VRAYLVPRFGDEIAEEIKALEIQRWLKSLHVDKDLAWPTIAKIRGVMHRIYKIGIVHGHVAKSPLMHIEARSKRDYMAIVITPAQTLVILHSLPSPLHFTLVLTCPATPLRASEMLSLRWADVLWEEDRIFKRWAKGADGEMKTEASDGLRSTACRARAFSCVSGEAETQYAADGGFVFPSLRAKGRLPLPLRIYLRCWSSPRFSLDRWVEKKKVGAAA